MKNTLISGDFISRLKLYKSSGDFDRLYDEVSETHRARIAEYIPKSIT